MRRVGASDTGPERQVRKVLTGLGLRYRLQSKQLPGKPDIVLPGRRIAIFVHGCFWHGHDCPRGARVPKSNTAYWLAKVRRNCERDEAVQGELERLGWRPVVIWECEIKAQADLIARMQTEVVAAPSRK